MPAAVLAGGGKQVGNDEIMRELQELRNQVSQQQAEIDMLKGQKPADTTGLSTRVDALEQKKGYVVALTG